MRRRTSTTFASAAAAAVLVLAACGGDDGATGTAAALPPKVRLSAGWAAAGGADASATRAAMDVAPGGRVEIVAGPGLPALDDAAASWRFTGGVTAERVAALAKALGLDGDVVARPADEGGGWLVGAADGSAPSLSVSAGAMGDWWYNPGPVAGMEPSACLAAADAEKVAREGTAATSSGGGEAAASEPAVATDGRTATATASTPAGITTTPAPPDEPCPAPAPPAGVPGRDEALAAARTLLRSLGVDLGGVQLEAYADEWSASVTAWTVLDGVRAPVSAGVSFGADGALTWASGVLGGLERGPEYPRAGTARGVERLQEQQAGSFAVPMDAGARTAVALAPSAGGDAATSGVAVNPAPGATTGGPTDEVTTLTATGVEASLWMVWNSPDDIWLVPGYTFTTDDGGERQVIAISDEYLEVAEPEPAIDGTAGGGPASSGSGSSATDPTAGAVSEDQAATLLGLGEDEAAKAAAGNGWAFRVVERDGEGLAATDDLDPARVNAVVTGGVVVDVTIG